MQEPVPITTHEEPLASIEYVRGQENLCSGTSVVKGRKRRRDDIFYISDESESSAEESGRKRHKCHSAPERAWSFTQTPGRSMKRKIDEEPADNTSQGQDGSPPLKKRVSRVWGLFKDFLWRSCRLLKRKEAKKRKYHQKKKHRGQMKPKIDEAGVAGTDISVPTEEEAPAEEVSPAPAIDVPTPTERVTAPLSPDSFIFHKLIDEGSFGKVVLATHRDSGRLVAVKIVKKRSEISDNPNALFVERKILEMVGDIPFCTHTHATFQTEDHLFYVMEYLNGGDLYEMLYTIGTCDVDTIRFLAAELICGLQSLHSKGILHRDLKLGNILLDGAGHVKICDFGLSVTDMFGDKTARGLVGTPSYMAPEMVRNLKYDTSVDYFSLGVLLYEMAFDNHPFSTSDNNRDIVKGIKYHQQRYPVHTDPDFMDFMNKILHKNQRKRKEAIANIREHPFFQGINWEELEAGKALPPCELMVSSEIDTSTTVDLKDLLDYDQLEPVSQEDQKRFNGFSFASQTW